MILTNENYFSTEASMEYMSVSQFKAFESCEAAALAEAKGEYKREETTSLLVGKYVTLRERWMYSKHNIQIFLPNPVH